MDALKLITFNQWIVEGFSPRAQLRPTGRKVMHDSTRLFAVYMIREQPPQPSLLTTISSALSLLFSGVLVSCYVAVEDDSDSSESIQFSIL